MSIIINIINIKRYNIRKSELFMKNKTTSLVKPFLKWAGGKGQLLNKIELIYPFDENITKYAEPFVGGGAVLFDILNKYDLNEIYISDINSELINTYKVIQNNIEELIYLLWEYHNEYIYLDDEDRKIYYNYKRDLFNEMDTTLDSIRKAALMIFLNKTCFNGLYRVNKQGLFNVPMGKYKKPCICDEENLRNISAKLQNVEIVCGDYRESRDFIDNHTFVYFDPPYRPITKTSNFTSYNKDSFTDDNQIELGKFVDEMDKRGAKIAISSSDPKNIDPKDNFIDDIYSKYNIKRVEANRMINSKGNSRGKINELLICNY